MGRDLVFSCVGLHFWEEGCPIGGIGFDGSGHFQKISYDGESSPAPLPNYEKPWYICTTSFKNINIDIMECFVVTECIYNVYACKTSAFLCYIANKLFGQRLFEKLEERHIMIVKNHLLQWREGEKKLGI